MAITTPPFRTSLLTANGVPFGTGNGDIQTTKDWWLYWNQLTDRSNANSKLATEGTHADRPENMPDGALYYESDRGVLYAHADGHWQYVAGTMWGTLSPDQRPLDLGTHDAGFDFRGTDQPREFLWSQTAWIEITGVGGAAALTHPNVVTKVGTSGQIVEGGITDLSAANSGRVIVDAAGNVGIGTSPAQILHTKVSSGDNVFRMDTASKAAGVLKLFDATGDVTIQTSGVANAIYIATAGQVGLGMTGMTFRLQLPIDSAAKPGTSTWSVVSDLRLKQNIVPVKDDSLAILEKLDWIRYEYNGKAETPRGMKAIGLIGQEVEKQLPEAVRSTKTKLNETDAEEIDVLAIDYHHILVHSALAIQQLSAEVKSLKAMLGKP